MKASQTRAEPMNASPHHSKVKISVTLGNSTVVAGQHVSGKMEVECKGDPGLGLNVMMVELFAIQELTSRDHSATSTFIHSRRVFQGPGLPPSNAVQPYPAPGDPPMPPHYHQSRRGISTFLFRFPIHPSAPASVNIGSGLAAVRYEIKASVQVAWKGQRTLVTDKKTFQLVESFDENEERIEPEGIVVAENAKIWMQGKIVGGVIVAGESACVELQVKNHSSKKNTGLYITLTRALQLPEGNDAPIQISDTLATIPFRGPEFVISPGAEGIASLVFDVPPFARTVHGGLRYSGEPGRESMPALFEVKCILGVKMTMGIGSKDVRLDIPVRVVHPLALPELPPAFPFYTPWSIPQPPTPPHVQQQHVAVQPVLSSQGSPAYYDQTQNLVWFSPSPPFPQPYAQPPPPPPTTSIPGRPFSMGLPIPGLPIVPSSSATMHDISYEEGKGQRASRISQHLHYSSRNRSVSPMSHRFPIPTPTHAPHAIPPPPTMIACASLEPGLAPPGPVPIARPRHSMPPSTSVLRSLSSDLGDVKHPIDDGLPSMHRRKSHSNIFASPILHSPRPFKVSPTHSFHSPMSENVEGLERMVEDSTRAEHSPNEFEPRSSDAGGDSGVASPPSLLPPGPISRERRHPIVVSPVSAQSPVTSLPKAVHIDLVAPSLGRDVSSSPVLHSPRPLLSPKHSSDNLKSGDVEELERIADNLGQHGEDKPLPSTPFSEAFLLADDPSPDRTPPTPTLAAVTPHPRAQRPQLATSGEGLDALERRLLEKVGTKKMEYRFDDDNVERGRPDVRSVLQPIAIPARHPPPPEEPVNESAISSFSLGAQMEPPASSPPPPPHNHLPPVTMVAAALVDDDIDDDKTHYNPRSSDRTGGGERGEQKKHGPKKEKSSKEHYRHKKLEVEGRVAAWLGALQQATPSSAPISPPPISPVETQQDDEEEEGESNERMSEGGAEKEEQKPLEEKTVEELLREEEGVSGPPPPQLRSSGFVPVESFKRGTFYRPGITTKMKFPPITSNGQRNPAASEARRVAELWASPPSAVQALKKEDAADKLDHRSARGGRGGIVTSVAAIWANKDEGSLATAAQVPLQRSRPKRLGAQASPSAVKSPPIASSTATPKPHSTTSTPKPPTSRSPVKLSPNKVSPPTKYGAMKPPLKVMRAPLAPKVTSGPLASLTSVSHATPMLSSTASLAQPVISQQKPVIHVDSDIPEEEAPVVGARDKAKEARSSTKPELAFGQARLRDLIRKYQQGQG